MKGSGLLLFKICKRAQVHENTRALLAEESNGERWRGVRGLGEATGAASRGASIGYDTINRNILQL
jgi:hypothetical protein